MQRVFAALVTVITCLTIPGLATATILGDPTLTVGAGRAAVAGEVDLGLSDDIETNRFWIRGDYGFAPNIDGFLRAGIFDGDFGAADIDGYGFGGGVRMDLVQEKDWHFGGLAQVMYNRGEVDIPGFTVGPITIPGQNVDVDWFELDLAGAASFRGAGPLVPYGGAKIGYITGDDPVDNDLGFTLFGGATYAVAPQLLVGGELRIIDDDALGLFVRYTF